MGTDFKRPIRSRISGYLSAVSHRSNLRIQENDKSQGLQSQHPLGRIAGCHRSGVRAAAHHLIEGYRGFDIFEKDDIPYARHIHTGGQQFHGGGDKVVFAGRPEIGKKIISAAFGGAFECV